jgi:hypothetical protein
MPHTRTSPPLKPSPRAGYASISFGAIVILGGVVRLAAAYDGSKTLYWVSFALVFGGLVGVALTGLRAAKRRNGSAG